MTTTIAPTSGVEAASSARFIGPAASRHAEEQFMKGADEVARFNAETAARYADLPWEHAVGRVFWAHLDRVQANAYNPNSVPRHEMNLLHTSISSDSYTQPVVSIWDPEATGGLESDPGRFVIIDGFHRYSTMLRYDDIYATTGGFLPIVVLEKSLSERMAATVRHNRARGSHSVQGMSSLVFQMLKEGRTDADICHEFGMEAEELVRLKHITGYSKLFKDHSYSKQPMTEAQMAAKAKYKKENPGEHVPSF